MPDRQNRIVPVILSGGSGSRLWPLSREASPKQFLSLTGDVSLFERTAQRVADPERFAPTIVVANHEHRFLVAECLRRMALRPPTILLEPCARNTAPAVAAAALLAMRSDPDALLLIMPSDHVIADETAFRLAIDSGIEAARNGLFVLFGIPPTAPSTGYGYIRTGTRLGGGARKVDRFVEKPNSATAERYVADGGYLWNSGIFLMPARNLVSELERFEPLILTAARTALDHATVDMDFLRLAPDPFAASPSISLDYAVMERTDRAAVVPADMGWTDLGSWSSLKDIAPPDADGNVITGPVETLDVTSSYLHSTGPLVAALGVDGLTVVATPDAVLVTRTDRDQDVKRLVDQLKAKGHASATLTTTVHRPWGYYQSVHAGDRFQVKRITVRPGARLSLQKHAHRAEHWVVVNGTALVTRNGEEFLLHENESVFLPLGCVHRLTNPGSDPLNLIEVQSGGYLGEDDIERFDDDYARA